MKNTTREIIEASAEKESAKAQQKKTKSGKKNREVLYQVKTKRDSGVLKAYITFTYRVFHPKVTSRLILYGILVAVPGFFIKVQWLSIALWIIGALMLLLGFFRQYISLALTKKSDPDYRSGADFTYEFTQNDASFYRNGELTSYISKYKDIDAIYHDEKYYYLSLKTMAFYIIPKDRFVIGDQADFGDFIYKKCNKTCRWIPARFGNKVRKWQSSRAIARDQMNR